MQYSTVGANKVSRFGIGTKRLPTTDITRVTRIDCDQSREILKEAISSGSNYVNTSYSDRKGEAEAFLGDELAGCSEEAFIATSFFELVDPRYEYVFEKQLKKLRREVVDFYFVEGVCDLTRMRDIDSGAVDYLFDQREAGRIAHLGFSSDLNPENLRDHLKRYPWDFVRLRVNYFDWYLKGAREQYTTATELCTPIIAHAALRTGPREHLRPEARAILSEAAPERSEIDWALRFVKTLDNVRVVTCNVNSIEQYNECAAVFDDDVELNPLEMSLLGKAAREQQTRR